MLLFAIIMEYPTRKFHGATYHEYREKKEENSGKGGEGKGARSRVEGRGRDTLGQCTTAGKSVRCLFVVADRKRQPLFDPGLDDIEETRVFQVGTRCIVGKVAALLGPDRMNCTTFAEAVVGKQDAGSVIPGFKSVGIFQKPSPDLIVTDVKVSGQPGDICVPNGQGRSWKSIAAIAGARAAV